MYYIRVTGLDGTLRDSIRVAGPGQALWGISSVPGTNWIVTLVLQAPHGLWQVMDRSGKVADHVVNACTCGGIATRDAVWLARAGDGLGEAIVRIGLDPKNGRLATQQDTMVTGLFTSFSLTSDGLNMVMDAGTYDHSVWALEMSDLMAGKFAEDRRIAHASSGVSSEISPDGSRILMRRLVPTEAGLSEVRYSLRPFGEGTETPLGGAGVPVRASWSDSVTVAVTAKSPTGTRLSQTDVRTGAQRNVVELPDSVLMSATPLANGWAWVPANGQSILIREAGKTRTIPMPGWYAFLGQVESDVPARRVYFTGWNRTTGDTLGLSALSLDDGSIKQVASVFGEGLSVGRLADGVLVKSFPTQESVTLLKLPSQGPMQTLGTIPRPVRNVSTSSDLKRATADERDYRADAWMSKVVVP